ncbi:hypothetical protein [Nocardiopsis sp. NPDC058789]|uniref:TlpA family protein disulfide reductase n=1 Tax=Nocardiopsis sp. NPDC058789 TaxID=3346634 RepID=UPI0036706E69
MDNITGAVVLIGVVSVLNLVLTLAVIRRLRETSQDVRSASASGPATLDELPAGTPIPSFRATTPEGKEVTSDEHLGQQTVYAFFDTSCTMCKSRLTPLVERARHNGLTPEQVVVVIGDADGRADEYTTLLDDGVTVIVEEPFGPVAQEFPLQGVPTFILADESGRVTRSGPDLDAVPAVAR